MALVEPRNSGTKTLCKHLSQGKQEIMIFIDNVAPPFIPGYYFENPGQNISYTYLHDNCIFKRLSATVCSNSCLSFEFEHYLQLMPAHHVQ